MGLRTDRTLDKTGHGRTNRAYHKVRGTKPPDMTGQGRTKSMTRGKEQTRVGPGTNRTTRWTNRQNHIEKTDETLDMTRQQAQTSDLNRD